MSKEIKLIQPTAVARDANGWWLHPELPAFDGCWTVLAHWLSQQGLELKRWTMEADISDHHPYDDGAAHCIGWEPASPGAEWFLLAINDSEDGPCVTWARRAVTP
ncbi:hypothetical protein [Pseudomonas putida]|uniref:Uncharacterized protein n=1 Tax=Pseudomonas putida TaxID=303 RepID=A0A1Q9R360_PSEPU|nr:hypothetical protein [Pseudomonas putida]OLS61850.1 hypothetical protein PSEMO_32230 [Pseudomonas putida]